MGKYYQKAVSATHALPPQHIHVSGQGAERGRGCPGYQLVLLCLAPPPWYLLPHPVPHLCPRVSRHRWFSARRRFLPISPHSVGPTTLDAALLHSSGSEQGAGCPECTGEGPGCPSVNHESFLQIHSINVWGFFKQALTPSTANTAFALTYPLQKQLGGLYTARGTEVMGTAQRGKKITQKAASCQPK